MKPKQLIKQPFVEQSYQPRQLADGDELPLLEDLGIDV